MVGKVTTSALHESKFVCNLAVGTYKVQAAATDPAGNKQTKSARTH